MLTRRRLRSGARWDRGGQVVIEAVLLLTMLFGVVGAGFAVVSAVADHEVVTTVGLAPERVDLGSAAGYSVHASSGTVTVTDPSIAQVVAFLIPAATRCCGAGG